MSLTQLRVQTITDSYKEAVPDRNTQPGLEAVYLQGPGSGWGYAQQQPLHAQAAPPAPPGVGKRKMFWLFVALGVLAAAVIGLAVGLGVGLAKGNDSASSSSISDTSNNSTSPSISPSPSSTASTTTSSTSTSTSTSDDDDEATSTLSSTSSTQTASPVSTCPGSNNTIVSPTLGSISYRIHCDSDWGGSGKKTLASLVLSSFDECLGLCNTMNYFQDRKDVGCTFNAAGTGTQTPGTCWCLGGEGIRVTSNVGNEAAMPVSD